MLKNKIAYLLGAVPALIGAEAFAQVQQDESLRVSTLLDLRAVDNAARRANPQDEDVSELQGRASLLAFGQLQGRIYDLETDYSLRVRRNSEFKQRDEQRLLGESVLLVGPSNRRHYVRFGHSSREFLIDPQESDLPENRDSRDIFTAGGYTSVYLGRPNTLSLEATASDIQFDEYVQNEAQRVSLGATLSRAVSPLHTLGVNAMAYNLRYTNRDQELDYRQVALLWQGNLKQVEYSIELGQSAMRREEGGIISSPLIRMDWAYRSAAQTFTVRAARWLSDTSQGGGREQVATATAGVDGRVRVVDQFERTDASIGWAHANPCDSCTLTVGFDMQEEAYVSFPELSSREFNLAVDGTYQVNRGVGLRLQTLVGTYSEYLDEDNNDYVQTIVDAAVTFPQLVRDGVLEVFVGVEGRDFEEGQGWTSGFVGARFEYLLLTR